MQNACGSRVSGFFSGMPGKMRLTNATYFVEGKKWQAFRVITGNNGKTDPKTLSPTLNPEPQTSTIGGRNELCVACTNRRKKSAEFDPKLRAIPSRRTQRMKAMIA